MGHKVGDFVVSSFVHYCRPFISISNTSLGFFAVPGLFFFVGMLEVVLPEGLVAGLVTCSIVVIVVVVVACISRHSLMWVFIFVVFALENAVPQTGQSISISSSLSSSSTK